MKLELQQMVDNNKLAAIKSRIENNSTQIEEIVEGIINPYCKDLDRYVDFVSKCLKDGEEQPTTSELEDYCMNLSTNIYWASGMCEQLGIRSDIAKAVYDEMYNASRNSIQKGTVADKDTLAALNSQEEAIIASAYSRAYKILKAKIDSAQKLLQSASKVLSHRMQEEELTRIQKN